ncbi:MAG: phosphomannomutase/phosphoglucomutase [Clostridiales bacterium]|jgi:phosphomannomutase|nr:phosphomannomutase/phosphoglucomutase [Clostridiales bacterium]
MELKSLKSGSDIRGTATPDYGERVTLTDEAVAALVNGFVVFLKKKYGDKDLRIALGRDSRLSSAHISEICIEVLKKAGTEIFDGELFTTPAAFYMTKNPEVDADGAVMITASHHPKQRNGLKFFTKAGGLDSAELDAVIAYAEAGETVEGARTVLRRRDYLSDYAQTLIELVRRRCGNVERPLGGLKIVVDAGNGAGGFFARNVLRELGADTTGSQYLEPDGNFPNHVPNPEDAAAMSSIRACVKDNAADLGVIFDTDVDRAAIVLADGRELNRNGLIALSSAILLEEQKGAYIVTDSVTSDGLRKFIESKGGFHMRYKRGYRNVINEAKRLNAEGRNAVLAIETSGHAAFRENNFLDDGAYLAARIIAKLAELKKDGKTLLSLIEGLEEPLETAEIRLSFKTPDFAAYGERMLRELRDFSEKTFTLAPSTYEGVRTNIDYADGWFLARISVHDPVLPVNIESRKKGGARLIARLLYSFLSAYSGIDSEPLKRYIES